jgi:high-affinity iron transporter
VDSLVITFREGIEAALVIGIMLAYVRKTGRDGLGRSILGGTVAAVAFSAVTAVALGLSGIKTDDPILEGVLYVVAAIAVMSMVIWMRRNSRGVRGRVESRVQAILGTDRSTHRIGGGLFLLAFFMVAREGVETLLFISAGAMGGANTSSIVIGGIVGLVLAVAYGALFARGSARIDLKLFFTLTSAVLMLLAVKLVGGSIHEFEEAGLIRMSQTMAHFFDVFGGSPVIDWLFVVALIVPLLAPYIRRRGTRTPVSHAGVHGALDGQ